MNIFDHWQAEVVLFDDPVKELDHRIVQVEGNAIFGAITIE